VRSSLYHKVALFTATALTLGVVCACSSGSSADGPGSTGSGPELSNVTVGALDIPDAVTLRIAQNEGFFKQQGLNVTIETLTASTDTTPALLAHTLDFTSSNYVGMYEQDARTPALQLKVLVDDGEGSPGVSELMVPKNSAIKSVADLAGKKIALPSVGVGIGPLSVNVLLSEYHIPSTSYTAVAIPFPDMPTALKAGEVDAAWVTEPFVTILEAAGAHPLADTFSGSMNGFPISCWATTGWFAQHYPKTTAAFQRAMLKAQQVAASDPTLVRQLLPTYIKGLTPQIANVMTLENFNTTPSLTRMDRVLNVMNEFKLLPASFNVNSLIYPLPSGS
jgi:NitT/TauT family transport system substrate-binding protein